MWLLARCNGVGLGGNDGHADGNGGNGEHGTEH